MPSHVVVEDGEVAAGHVRDDDRVPVLHQLPQDSTHRDDVVVGVRRECDDALVARQLGSTPDLRAERIEHLAVERSGRAVQCHQCREPMLGVVMLGQLENRFAGLLGEPGDRPDRARGGPFDRAQQPRGGHPGQPGGGSLIQEKRGVGVPLEEGGGDLVVHLALDRAAHDLRLVLPGGEDEDLPCLQDGGHPHGDRLPGDVLLAEKVGGAILSSHQVESDQPGAALDARSRLVESDVPGSPDAQQLQIDAARSADRLLVSPALRLYRFAGNVAPGDVNVGRRDVQLRKQIFHHEPMVGMEAPRSHRVVLIEVEGHHLGKAESFFPVQPNQLPIHSDGRRAGGQAQNGMSSRGRAGPDYIGDPSCDQPAELVVILDDGRADVFRACPGVGIG